MAGRLDNKRGFEVVDETHLFNHISQSRTIGCDKPFANCRAFSGTFRSLKGLETYFAIHFLASIGQGKFGTSEHALRFSTDIKTRPDSC